MMVIIRIKDIKQSKPWELVRANHSYLCKTPYKSIIIIKMVSLSSLWMVVIRRRRDIGDSKRGDSDRLGEII